MDDATTNEQEQISEAARAMGRLGGRRRADAMTPEQRREAASRAGRAPRPGARKAKPQDAAEAAP